MLQLIDDELAIFLFLGQAFGDIPLTRGDRPIVLDAPYREAAYREKDHQQRDPGGIGGGVAEIDAYPQRTAEQGRREPDPQASERGGKEHGRKIGRKKY